jgi:hypothetical protein
MTERNYTSLYRRMTGMETPVILSADQRKLIRHALGLDREKVAYRNHYAATPGNPEFDAWCDLEKRDLAKSWEAGGFVYFAASGPAARAVVGRTESFSQEIIGSLAKVDCHLKANQSN